MVLFLGAAALLGFPLGAAALLGFPLGAELGALLLLLEGTETEGPAPFPDPLLPEAGAEPLLEAEGPAAPLPPADALVPFPEAG